MDHNILMTGLQYVYLQYLLKIKSTLNGEHSPNTHNTSKQAYMAKAGHIPTLYFLLALPKE